MTPGVVLREQQQQNLEKQMGCMAGFFQIFDRHQILAGKRINSTKRLPSSPATSSPTPSERSDLSAPSFSKELGKDTEREAKVDPTVLMTPARPSSTPLPLFEFKEGAKSSWKLREAPRLSLDSRLLDRQGKLFPPEIRTSTATAPVLDAADDQQRRSPSVVARLMGLDVLPKINSGEGDGVALAPSVPAVPELRRSASESRVVKDFLQYQFLQEMKNGNNHAQEKKRDLKTQTKSKPKMSMTKPPLSPSPPSTMPNSSAVVVRRRSSFNAQDFFPEPSKRGVNNHHHNGGGGNLGNGSGGNLIGEIEKRLRMRGIDEPAKDLETLKQILEALQLKGLLHSTPHRQHHCNQTYTGRTLVFDQHHPQQQYQSPIVVMKPATTIAVSKSPSRFGTPPPPSRKSSNDLSAARRTETLERRGGRNSRNSPDPTEPARRPSSPSSRKTPNLDRRTSPAESPRSGQSPRRLPVLDPTKSPRIKKQLQQSLSSVERFDDDSESSHSASSQFDHERVKSEEYREGRSLLERCDKLLHSIAEITAAEQQPSPVSVLDSAASFSDSGGGGGGGGGDLASPSPVLKRCIDFGDEAVGWDQVDVGSTQLLAPEDEAEAMDRDFNYVAEIFGSTNVNASSMAAAVAMPLDVYLSLEKWHQKDDCSKASRMHRRLVFDTVTEIVEGKWQVSSWESFSRSRSTVLDCASSRRAPARETWVELKRIREQVPADDLCELVCNILRKDITKEARGWSDRSVEMSDAVLDIERLIFKDLVAETIKDLSTSFAPVQKYRPAASIAVSRRKLLF